MLIKVITLILFNLILAIARSYTPLVVKGLEMYNDIIIKNFTAPEKVGDLDINNCEFEIGNSVCGDRIKVQLMIENEQVNQARFRAWGCATSIATANIFCVAIEGKYMHEINNKNLQQIESMLGELEPSQYHCVHILSELHEQLASKVSVGVS